MMNKREINEYLFYEFAEDGDSSRISDGWPFQLSEVGTYTTSEGESEVFLFADNDEEYFAVTSPSLTYYRRAGMDLAQLHLQALGSLWISGQGPVDLNTSILADESIPPTLDRRQHIDGLARQYLGDRAFSILEGLFLRRSSKYLALIQSTDSEKAVIVGTNLVVRNIPFPSASAWRRLAVGMGTLVQNGKLG